MPQTAAAVRRTQELPSSWSRASRRILRFVCSHLPSLLCARLLAPPSASECSSCARWLLLVVRGCLCSILPPSVTRVSSRSLASRGSSVSSPAAEATRGVVSCFVAFCGVVADSPSTVASWFQAPDKAPLKDGSSINQLLGIKGAAQDSNKWKIQVQFTKSVTWPPLVWGVVCGAAASGNFHWTIEDVAKSIAGMLMSGPFLTGYTQTINDWYDREIRIPSGVISENEVITQTWVLLLGGLGLAGLLDVWVVKWRCPKQSLSPNPDPGFGCPKKSLAPNADAGFGFPKKTIPPKKSLPPNPDTSFQKMVLYLESIGLDSFSVIENHPKLITASLDDIKSTVEYIMSMDFTTTEFRRIVGMCPDVLTTHVSDIIPVFTFLLREAHVKGSDIKRVIHRRPRLLVCSVNNQLRPTLYYLQSIGIEEVSRHTDLLSCSVQEKLIPRIDYFENIGFSRRDATTMFRRFPPLFCYSIKNNLEPKYNYFVVEMGRDLKELKEFPQYFSFSLENRIKPRHKRCIEMGVCFPLPVLLKMTEMSFQNRLDLCVNSSTPLKKSPLWCNACDIQV
ncbi:uncharacterized protein LOC107607466 [Arachis ipaensis]|uniref:uncharacterized protein LOC107607466 n=1 Tax=Arachis ipaensis TaxID=130454 RepID=UPI000A2B7B1D|nr:uncharacterized protein LOC107607466 [Arachis ipaensis]